MSWTALHALFCSCCCLEAAWSPLLHIVESLLTALLPLPFLPSPSVLQLAGGYFMTLLFGILPPVMAWQLRTKLAAKRGGTAPGTAAQSTAGTPGSHASTSPALLGSGEVLLPAVNAPSSAAGTAAAGAQGQQQRQARGQPWWQLHEEMVPGGTLVLGGLFSAAMFIELSRLAADLGSLAGSGSDGSGGQPGHVQVG